MAHKFWHLALLSLVVAGCSPPGESSSIHSGNGAALSSQSSSNPQDTPDRAVFNFLEAVRTGNEKQTAAMLTPTALQKTSEMQMDVAPPSSPTAKFTVGRVKYVTPNKDGAYVSSTWTDVVDSEGHTRSDDIVWVLRHEAEGWRIAGMVTTIYPDQPPLVLNFEDPEDMLRKQQLLHEGTDADRSQSQPSGEPQANRGEQVSPVTR
jgi:hypothetical protein